MDAVMLQPGDVLLYSGTGFFSWLIKKKTWSEYSHVEVYAGCGWSFASRNGIGVQLFKLDRNIAMIRRHRTAKFDLVEAMRWFVQCAFGQKYDWKGLFRFFTIGKQSMDKSHCAELATRVLRAGKTPCFSDEYDADLVAPGTFESSFELMTIYDRKVSPRPIIA